MSSKCSVRWQERIKFKHFSIWNVERKNPARSDVLHYSIRPISKQNFNFQAKGRDPNNREPMLFNIGDNPLTIFNTKYMGILDFLRKGTEKPVTPSPQKPQADNRQQTQSMDTYTVVSGDTLSKIAKSFYGKSQEWPRIFDANRDQIKDPNLIHPGQVLKIPKK